ncbi:5'-3' exoribonuclease 4-like isoform X3 [Syzygium oleosum]|nr:5'-3' exoribonuclease 4-like isoform X3 [Syzygium oleosum]XP_056172534.1 5'-3' exoribonuclease 4-like isoform X3 [Syzygium oleosum]XP_056172535.1 5'-3' exoribonuclease 4-like isoform X3 [Syzygium oleosum]
MNGFLWLSERNVLTNVIPSPIHGLEDIVNNQVYNVTYLNPAKHKHIPRPPAGVVIPPKVLGPLDTKPFPVLWHEDNSGRRQNGRERPSVPGAMVGPMLGEAAHRLVKSTLNIKLNNNQSSGILEPPRNRNFLGYYAVNRPRPAAPSGYERGFSEDTHQYHGNHNYTII